ncbi:MAG: ferritin family protein [Anaerolineae bacterium]|jgi:rubrerythrin
MAILTGEELIEIAMQLEEEGEAFYNAAAKQATTTQMKELFEDLAIQEQYHYRAFQQMGRDIVRTALSDEQWDQFQEYTGALLNQRVFDKPDGDLSNAVSVQDEREALEAALGFEKETLKFYQGLRGVVKSADQQTVDRIIGEEEQHIRRLSSVLSVR